MDVFAHCENLVREADKDRFLASLFAPAEGRRDLFALYAFNAEVAGVQDKVREPLAGEIRLQYWHDLVAGTGEPGANPVAAALLEIVKRHALPRQPLLELLEARRFDLYEETFSTRADLENYASNTSSAVIELAMRILDQPSGATPGLARSAGIAYAIAGLARSFAFHASRGKIFVPDEILTAHGAARADILAGRSTIELRDALADFREQARRHLDQIGDQLAEVPDRLVPALLPVALVDPYLARMERADYEPFRTVVEVPQWRKQWLLWRAARSPRRIAAH
ncbi:MAG TPA: phytoene/squalene synthase family protein [Xanthobacteraceae bacterium]